MTLQIIKEQDEAGNATATYAISIDGRIDTIVSTHLFGLSSAHSADHGGAFKAASEKE